jgi:hypothetical protein
MSLIVDINPVPWKILDLVRARILKNRATKAKKGTDWSKETLKRETSLRPGPLLRRKKDEPSFVTPQGVDVGVGWLHIAQNYTIISNNQYNVASEWTNGDLGSGSWPSFSFADGNPGIYDGRDTMRTRSSGYSANASLEIDITVGTRSGETWKRAKHTLYFNGLSNSFRQDDWTWIEGIGVSEKVFITTTQTDNFDAKILWGLFPAGGTSTILVVSIIQFNHAYSADSSMFPLPSESVTVQNTKQISFLITESEITEVTHSLPVYVQKDIDLYLAQDFIASVPGYDITVNPARTTLVGFSSIATYTERVWWLTSSAVFEGIAQNGALSFVEPQQAKSSYATFSGKAEIPVLRYKPNDPLAASTPKTEEGYFGIIPGASVTSSITSAMLAAELEDVTEQSPGPNAANQPEPVQFFVAYDYHGGSYCRDQLKRIGITL